MFYLKTGAILKYFLPLLILLSVWSLLWSTIGEEALPPNGSLFNVLLLLVVSYTCGQLVSMLGLPPLLAMLIVGLIFGNAYQLNLNQKLSSILRSIALTVILLRAGLAIDPQMIRRLSGVCFRLSLIPCIIEATTFGLCAHLLIDFPIQWGLLLGFILSAVSSAIVIPDMIILQEKQLGTNKGIPTLLIASNSVDNVMAITGFGVCLGLVFDSSSSIVWNVFKGPVEVVSGVVVGIVFGLILWIIPNNNSKVPEDEPNFLRLALLLLFGLNCIFVSTALDFGGAGPLGCVILAFVASLRWKPKSLDEPIREYLKYFWIVFEPLLFVLIGTEVKISDLKGNTIGLGIVSLFIALIVRSITSMAVVFGADLTLKEKLFIAIAWLPKATVQAAIGPIALDRARALNDTKLEELAKFVLTIAVLSIIITAPLGAIAISLTKNRLLTKSSEVKDQDIENAIFKEPSERTELL